MPAQTASWSHRFWSKVDVRAPNDCWEWSRACDGHGYGAFKLKGRQLQAHRLAYILCHGDIPHRSCYHGICVLHCCDNPACCNPLHLFLGTSSDNARDQANKGRSRSGKLGLDTAEAIRQALTAGASQAQLADQHHVNPSCISRIASGQAYRKLTP